jgi:hypothetical protein
MVGTFNVCNFSRKTNEIVDNDKIDVDMLVAGISLPIFMPPVARNGAFYVDSVWIKDANCMEAVRRGAEEIWIVWCIGNTSEYRSGAFRQYVHMIELSANGALFDELEHIRSINERIANGETVDGRTAPIRVHLIKPEYPLPLDDELYLGRIDTGSLIDMGYRDAVQYLRRPISASVPLGPEATRMRDPSLGVAFRETMSGPFALDEIDPRAGARRGRDKRLTLSLHASIEVTDVGRFLSDPNHAGSITGHLDFAPLGENLPSKIGVFNLFSGAPGSDTKYMVYELGFEASGKDYYLAGRKEVREGRALHFWRDTTTLFTQLHAGRDATGPVIGAGILSLSVAGLLQMIPTMAARNARSLGEWGEALGKFGAFFSSRLYDIYVNPKYAEGA